MTAQSLHRVTGAILVLFVLLHMITHLSGLWGIDSYTAMQGRLRLIYRNPVVEPLLLIAFAAQVVLGLRLGLRGIRRKLAQPWPRLQVVSGLIFAFFILQHLTAMAMARWIDGLDTGFYWPAAVMSSAPFYWYFTPYYILGVTSLFVHLGCALRLMLLRRGHRAAALRAFWLISALGAGLALVIVAMLLGAFYDITLPPEWQGYLRKFIPSHGL